MRNENLILKQSNDESNKKCNSVRIEKEKLMQVNKELKLKLENSEKEIETKTY